MRTTRSNTVRTDVLIDLDPPTLLADLTTRRDAPAALRIPNSGPASASRQSTWPVGFGRCGDLLMAGGPQRWRLFHTGAAPRVCAQSPLCQAALTPSTARAARSRVRSTRSPHRGRRRAGRRRPGASSIGSSANASSHAAHTCRSWSDVYASGSVPTLPSGQVRYAAVIAVASSRLSRQSSPSGVPRTFTQLDRTSASVSSSSAARCGIGGTGVGSGVGSGRTRFERNGRRQRCLRHVASGCSAASPDETIRGQQNDDKGHEDVARDAVSGPTAGWSARSWRGWSNVGILSVR